MGINIYRLLFLDLFSFILQQHHNPLPHIHPHHSNANLLPPTSSYSLDEYPLSHIIYQHTSLHQLTSPTIMPRATATKTVSAVAHTAPTSDAGVRKIKRTSSSLSPFLSLLATKQQKAATTTAPAPFFRLRKVPKYAKRALLTLYEEKNAALEDEANRLRRDWFEKECEIERLRGELKAVRGELKTVKRELERVVERDGDGVGGEQVQGQSTEMTREEVEELESFWMWLR